VLSTGHTTWWSPWTTSVSSVAVIVTTKSLVSWENLCGGPTFRIRLKDQKRGPRNIHTSLLQTSTMCAGPHHIQNYRAAAKEISASLKHNPSNTLHIFVISECHSEHHCKKPSHLCNLRAPVRLPLQKTFTTFVVSKHHSNLCNLIAPLQVLSGPHNHQQQRNYPHLQSMSFRALHNFLQSQSSHHSFWVLIFIPSLFPCHHGVESLITAVDRKILNSSSSQLCKFQSSITTSVCFANVAHRSITKCKRYRISELSAKYMINICMNLKTSTLFIAQKLHIWARVFSIKVYQSVCNRLLYSYILQPTRKNILRKVMTESQTVFATSFHLQVGEDVEVWVNLKS
jgi:hypothetical protein